MIEISSFDHFSYAEERKRFSQQSHEYLVTLLQHTGSESIAPGATSRTTNVRLSFNHPVKTLAWCVKNGATHGRYTTQLPGETSDKFAPIKSVRLQLNGHDRFDERTGLYFNQVQPFDHVEPPTKPAAGVYMYNFGLRANEIVQPSGSCNFSRIDNSTLVVSTKAGSVATTDAANVITDDTKTYANIEGNLTNLLVFAESYNVLRILSGMGGLAYTS